MQSALWGTGNDRALSSLNTIASICIDTTMAAQTLMSDLRAAQEATDRDLTAIVEKTVESIATDMIEKANKKMADDLRKIAGGIGKG